MRGTAQSLRGCSRLSVAESVRMPVMYCYVYLSVVSDCEGDGPISEGLFQAYSVAESVRMPVMYCYVYLSVVSDCEPGDSPISEGLFQAQCG